MAVGSTTSCCFGLRLFCVLLHILGIVARLMIGSPLILCLSSTLIFMVWITSVSTSCWSIISIRRIWSKFEPVKNSCMLGSAHFAGSSLCARSGVVIMSHLLETSKTKLLRSYHDRTLIDIFCQNDWTVFSVMLLLAEWT